MQNREEDLREAALQARDLARGLLLALVDEGIIPPDRAEIVAMQVTEALPDEDRDWTLQQVRRYAASAHDRAQR